MAAAKAQLKAHVAVKQIVLPSGAVHWGMMGTVVTGDSTAHSTWGFWSKVGRYMTGAAGEELRQAITRAIVYKPAKGTLAKGTPVRTAKRRAALAAAAEARTIAAQAEGKEL